MSGACAVSTSQQYLPLQKRVYMCRLFSLLSIMFHEKKKKTSTGNTIDPNTKSEVHKDIQQITFPFYRRQFHSAIISETENSYLSLKDLNCFQNCIYV